MDWQSYHIICMLARFPKPVRNTISWSIIKSLPQQCTDRKPFHPNLKFLSLFSTHKLIGCMCHKLSFLQKNFWEDNKQGVTKRWWFVKIIEQPSFGLQNFHTRVATTGDVLLWQCCSEFRGVTNTRFLELNPVWQHAQFTRQGLNFPFSTGQLGSVTSDKEWKLYDIDYYKLYLFLSTPVLLSCSDSFQQEPWAEENTSLVMVRVSCRGFNSEDVYMEVRCNLIANTDTVTDQIKEREDQGNPKHNIFINEAVKILV